MELSPKQLDLGDVYFGQKTSPADAYIPATLGGSGLEWLHYLRITAIDATQLREEKAVRVAWVGAALLDEGRTRDPSNPEELLDLFIAALLAHFPSATNSWLEVRVSAHDPLVRVLRGEE